MRKIFIFLLFAVSGLISVNADSIEVDRLSERIVILNEGYHRVVAVNTEKGIILIDTRWPKEKMEEIKQLLLLQEFNSDKVCYIINTHGCPEHILGNPALPNTPVIMNKRFFNRLKIYAQQKQDIDSLQFQCEHTDLDTSKQRKICEEYERRKFWRDICIEAQKIKPDVTFSEELNLYFENLTIQIKYTGLGHGYSNFIYIPEERFLHSSTIGHKDVPHKITIPQFTDNPEFLSWQNQVLKNMIDQCDSIRYVIPGHGEYYTGNELKQILNYFITMYDGVKQALEDNQNIESFKKEYTIDKKFANYTLFKDLGDETIKRHNKNIDFLWNHVR